MPADPSWLAIILKVCPVRGWRKSGAQRSQGQGDVRVSQDVRVWHLPRRLAELKGLVAPEGNVNINGARGIAVLRVALTP